MNTKKERLVGSKCTVLYSIDLYRTSYTILLVNIYILLHGNYKA